MLYYQHLTSFWIDLIVFIIGLCIGSFLNVVIVRLPKKESIISPGSKCPKCGHRLRWWENIPLISFIILKGRCSKCSEPISIQYPIVELITAILSVCLWLKYHFNIYMFLGYLYFVCSLIAIFFIDLKHHIIPDVISLPGIVIGILMFVVVQGLSPKESLIGAVVGAGIFELIRLGYFFVTKREGMGFGDVKLMGMIGAFLGWLYIPIVIFFSALIGTIYAFLLMFLNKAKRDTRIPYGPFLAIAALIALFFGPQILAFYRDLMFGRWF